ncbi:hypothetical protein BH09BAC6_BH09BAC6_31930 [soil metagenome]|jgi:hypothetical protein
MKRKFSLIPNIAVFSIILVGLASCFGAGNPGPLGGASYYTINGTQYTGTGANNTTLKAIEVPCQNNNTLRMYYSDSVATLGFPSTLKVVSYGKAGKLAYHEVYFEVVTSATDTYLSPGTDNVTFDSGGGQFFDFKNVSVQHFTSTPLNDFTIISGHLQLNK